MNEEKQKRDTMIRAGALVACLVVGSLIVWRLMFGGPAKQSPTIAVGEKVALPTTKPTSRPAPATRPGSADFFKAIEKGDAQLFAKMLEDDPLLVKVEFVSPHDQFVTPLHVAAVSGQLAMARTLLEQGADIHAVEERHKGTPLEWAVFGGKLEMVEFLLAKGAKVDDYVLEVAVRGAKGDFTPYTKTPREVYPKVTKLLLDAEKKQKNAP